MTLQTDDLVSEESEAEDILLETAWFVFIYFILNFCAFLKLLLTHYM